MNNLECKSPLVLLAVLILSLMLLLNPMNSATSKSADPFQQQEESKSKPFKIVVNLEYTEKQFREGVEYTTKIAMVSRKQKPMILMK